MPSSPTTCRRLMTNRGLSQPGRGYSVDKHPHHKESVANQCITWAAIANEFYHSAAWIDLRCIKDDRELIPDHLKRSSEAEFPSSFYIEEQQSSSLASHWGCWHNNRLDKIRVFSYEIWMLHILINTTFKDKRMDGGSDNIYTDTSLLEETVL